MKTPYRRIGAALFSCNEYRTLS